jgi:uroporphyrinogen-III synthase
MQVLVTRAASQSDEFTKLLEQNGIAVLETPTLELQPPSSYDALDRAINDIAKFQWLVFTSANGVNFFVERLKELGHTVAILRSHKLAVVGRKTAACLEKHGLMPDFIPPDFLSTALASHFPDRMQASDLAILYPCLETGCRDEWVSEMQALGCDITMVSAYESGCPNQIPPPVIAALLSGSVDVATFASPKTAVNFRQLLTASLEEEQLSQLLSRLKIAAIGPVTAATCIAEFGKVDIQPTEYTIEGLTAAIVEELKIVV